MQGYPQPVYGQPIYQPVMLPQAQQPPPEPEKPRPGGTQALRGVLILAAVVGLVTVVIGFVFMASSPEEYEPSGRSVLALGAQGGLPPTVGPGGPGQPLTQAAATAPPPAPPAPPAPPMQPSTPKRLIISKIGVNAPIKSVGTDRFGAIETPPINNHNLVGWYRGGPTPGEAGPAVMLGHKDTTTRSAVFSRLHELRYGDKFEVVRMDGTVAVFQVGGIEQANKTTFPTNRVYGPAANAELRLITCGGTYNRATGHYVDNVIVYATMIGTHLANR
ncbi:class F sortase [Microbispora sp. NPDC049125]|uniref:class F sortase n=1 Tax=Microbispora sp. NPDC049125 TaxID=3154929 RepID=UPI0034672A9C